jgi:hypothetical protein
MFGGLRFTEEHYKRDLQVALRLLDELNNCVMSRRRRDILETSLEAVLIVLDMYEVDNR